MIKINRNVEAVSPVIATILMVAITVTLAATLYMMVGDVGGDDITSLRGSFRHRDGTQFEINSISPKPGHDEVEITLLGNFVDGDGNDIGDGEISGYLDEEAWSFLNDDKVKGGSRFDIQYIEDASEVDWDHEDTDLEEVVLQISGVQGTMSYEM
ncbi:MAG: archaellin/type IV pilin N-terminal domain-containing protein [Thermoplasmata archaeon]